MSTFFVTSIAAVHPSLNRSVHDIPASLSEQQNSEDRIMGGYAPAQDWWTVEL